MNQWPACCCLALGRHQVAANSMGVPLQGCLVRQHQLLEVCMVRCRVQGVPKDPRLRSDQGDPLRE